MKNNEEVIKKFEEMVHRYSKREILLFDKEGDRLLAEQHNLRLDQCKNWLQDALNQQRLELIREIIKKVRHFELRAKKSYHKDSWDAGVHDTAMNLAEFLTKLEKQS